MKKKWEKIIEKFTWKKMIWFFISLFCIIVVVVIHGIRIHMVKQLKDQQVVESWTDQNDWAQISCFFSISEDVQEDTIKKIRYELAEKLEEASFAVDEENSSARLFVDSYSAMGEITLSFDENNFSGKAYGVGGDFFVFHPVTLVYGNYFSEANLMDDYVIIDEEIAWKLFGSSNVVGKYVTIQNIPHKIIGVYERTVSKMDELAGNDVPTLFLSYQSLAKYGTNKGIKNYEIIMPDPVSGFARNMVDEVLNMEEDRVSIVENSSRFQMDSLWEIATSFPSRSMSMNGIIYPFWENIARGYEDVAVILLKIELVLLVIPFCLCCFLFIWIRKITKRKLEQRKKKNKY